MTASPSRQEHTDWQALYTAAILETNKNLIPQKVYKAETAILTRGKELFGTYGTGKEKGLLADALHALRAFRTAQQYTEAA